MKSLTMILILIISMSANANSQVGFSRDFLLERNSSPVIMGLGGAGVAFPAADAASFSYNPAHLGFLMRSENLIISYNSNTFNPVAQYNMPYTSYAVNAGYDLTNIFGLPVTAGIAYMNQNVDIGAFTRIGSSRKIIEVNDASESSHSIALAASFEYFAIFSLGVTYKYYRMDLSDPITENINIESAAGSVFDFGLSAQIPVIKNHELLDGIFTKIDLNLGWALLNYCNGLDYGDDSDAAPRTSVLGYSTSIGFEYKKNDIDIEIIRLDWSAQLSENLVYRDSTGYKYDFPFNEVNFADNFLSLNAGEYINTGFGWQITIFETISYIRGWAYSTENMMPCEGLSVNTKGLVKLLKSKLSSKILDFASEHLSISYNMTKTTLPFTKAGNSWIYEKYQGINLAIKL